MILTYYKRISTLYSTADFVHSITVARGSKLAFSPLSLHFSILYIWKSVCIIIERNTTKWRTRLTQRWLLGFLHNLKNNFAMVERTRKFCLPSCYNKWCSTILFQLWLNEICSFTFNNTGSYLYATWCYTCRMRFVFKISMYMECTHTPCKWNDIIFLFLVESISLRYIILKPWRMCYHQPQQSIITFVSKHHMFKSPSSVLGMVSTNETCSIYCWN